MAHGRKRRGPAAGKRNGHISRFVPAYAKCAVPPSTTNPACVAYPTDARNDGAMTSVASCTSSPLARPPRSGSGAMALTPNADSPARKAQPVSRDDALAGASGASAEASEGVGGRAVALGAVGCAVGAGGTGASGGAVGAGRGVSAAGGLTAAGGASAVRGLTAAGGASAARGFTASAMTSARASTASLQSFASISRTVWRPSALRTVSRPNVRLFLCSMSTTNIRARSLGRAKRIRGARERARAKNCASFSHAAGARYSRNTGSSSVCAKARPTRNKGAATAAAMAVVGRTWRVITELCYRSAR